MRQEIAINTSRQPEKKEGEEEGKQEKAKGPRKQTLNCNAKINDHR
jgi:hypothetical protein